MALGAGTLPLAKVCKWQMSGIIFLLLAKMFDCHNVSTQKLRPSSGLKSTTKFCVMSFYILFLSTSCRFFEMLSEIGEMLVAVGVFI